MAHYRIAVIPGDGIGKEVIPEGIKVLTALSSKLDFSFSFDYLDWNCELHDRIGAMMPKNGLEEIQDHDAIYLGAVGYPGVPDHVSLWGLLIPIRRTFQQYVNIRPVRLFPGVPCPLVGRKPEDIDFIVVRENSEGEYSEVGGRLNAGTDDEVCIQENIFTRKGTDRILKFAFELAQQRQGKLTSATKSNGIVHTMPFWDERVVTMHAQYPDVVVSKYHIDILTAHFVLHPDWFDVVVGSNLFGDILSDLGPAISGTIGIAPSSNINPERTFPSMFEPVHGSAPDIANQGVANPIGAIWSAALMLDHLGQHEAHNIIMHSLERVIAKGDYLTRDMGGSVSTKSCGDAITSDILFHLTA